MSPRRHSTYQSPFEYHHLTQQKDGPGKDAAQKHRNEKPERLRMILWNQLCQSSEVLVDKEFASEFTIGGEMHRNIPW